MLMLSRAPLRFRFLEWDAARFEICAKALVLGGKDFQFFKLRLFTKFGSGREISSHLILIAFVLEKFLRV